MDTGLYFEEYDESWTFETPPVAITDARIQAFVELHGFSTPTYTDPGYMQAAYGGRLAPGLLVLCTAEGQVLSAGVTRRRGIFLMELTPRFLRPVHAGDTVAGRIRFQSKKPTSRPDRGVVVTTHEVVNGQGETVIRYDATRMIRTRAFVEPG
ncbi:MaoC family dehydratase [Xylophilus sp. GOD-11R]|uniref:MaoC family dehydratase n=1 Tax=Xylophilus sp. GOD-11R TaxID=3089814 RepID=UPI00298C8EA7|nr:MaoC family dehydratase N-terminal domain-containing protein [Xylophilus sp. GOD-11R]WPB55895.1 MaoC family dehydratase N-terminal domain-containing protein [Xylophilus sp. GOD-11R]